MMNAVASLSKKLMQCSPPSPVRPPPLVYFTGLHDVPYEVHDPRPPPEFYIRSQPEGEEVHAGGSKDDLIILEESIFGYFADEAAMKRAGRADVKAPAGGELDIEHGAGAMLTEGKEPAAAGVDQEEGLAEEPAAAGLSDVQDDVPPTDQQPAAAGLVEEEALAEEPAAAGLVEEEALAKEPAAAGLSDVHEETEPEAVKSKVSYS